MNEILIELENKTIIEDHSLKKYHNKFISFCKYSYKFPDELCNFATENGYLDILKYAHKNGFFLESRYM